MSGNGTGSDSAAARAAAHRSGRRTLVIQLVAVAVLLILSIGIIPTGIGLNRTTQECTVKSTSTIHIRRAPDYTLLRTTECGDIRTENTRLIEVIDPDCWMNTVKIGSRYTMTTVGWDFLLWDRQLEGPVTLVEAPDGEGCTGDSLYFDPDGGS